MTLAPRYFMIFSGHAKKVLWFAFLLFASVVLSRVFGMSDIFMADSVALESLLRTTFGFYTISSLLVFALFFGCILINQLAILIDPHGIYDDCIDIKNTSLPAIPYEADMFHFVARINSRRSRKDGRMPRAILDRFNVDDHGRLMD